MLYVSPNIFHNYILQTATLIKLLKKINEWSIYLYILYNNPHSRFVCLPSLLIAIHVLLFPPSRKCQPYIRAIEGFFWKITSNHHLISIQLRVKIFEWAPDKIKKNNIWSGHVIKKLKCLKVTFKEEQVFLSSID